MHHDRDDKDASIFVILIAAAYWALGILVHDVWMRYRRPPPDALDDTSDRT